MFSLSLSFSETLCLSFRSNNLFLKNRHLLSRTIALELGQEAKRHYKLPETAISIAKTFLTSTGSSKDIVLGV